MISWGNKSATHLFQVDSKYFTFKYKLFQPKISPNRKYIIMPKQSENHSLQFPGWWGMVGGAETFFRAFI